MNKMLKQRKGFTLIELLIVIAVIAILAAIAIPNLLASRKSANEASAIGSMRTINSAEATYRSRNPQYTNLAGLSTAGLLDYSLGNASSTTNTKSGYYFTVTPSSTSPSTSYFVNGWPTPNAGDRQFYTDESGTLFGAPIATAAPTTDLSGNPGSSGFSQIGQ